VPVPILVAGVLLAGIAAAPAASAATASAASAPPGVAARGAELTGADGAVLWSRSAGTRRPIGSITKVMTAYLVIESGHLNREIRVPASAPGYVDRNDGSSAGLIPGDRLTARELLYAMLIPSGCDAAYTLASAYGGQHAFIARMNSEARKLGLTRTHFSNFDGLPWPTEHSTYSTPHDLVILGRDAMRFPLFRDIVGSYSYHLNAGHGHHAYTWVTTNPLFADFPGADGIKTGSTDAAGYCLLFEARRGERSLIGVALGDSSMPAVGEDAATMLTWGFSR
jgi:serine-type D-Ala-D-Ala carboxypeptidase (penicillin-binding protein 5/6)